MSLTRIAGAGALALLLAGCAGQPGDYEAGVVPQSVDVAPDSPSQARARVFVDLASGYFARGQFKIVLEELRKAILVDPGFGPIYNLYGLVYMELAEDTLAEQNFRRALAINRSDAETRNNYGWFLCLRGRHDEGLAEFTQAFRNPLYDKPDVAMANAAQCADMKGDYELAAANFTRALKLAPESASLALRFAESRYRQQRYEDARQLLERAGKLAQPSAESLWLGLRIERKLGDAAQEAVYAQQLRRLFPDSEAARRLQAGDYE